MDIKVLGPGCTKCVTLADQTKKAADELGVDYTFEKVTDMNEFMKYGVMLTPALVVDGQVKVSGKVPSVEEIKELLA